MDPWYAKTLVIAGTVAMIAIRAPHGRRSRFVKVASHRKGTVERVVLTLAWTSFGVPIFWVCKSAPLSFAEYELRLGPLVAGAALMAFGLWLFARSHADLGTNWSITLEVREGHALVTRGVYRTIRHPMYASLLLMAVGQALAVPNGVAGPSYLVAMLVLCAARLGPEERMMVDTFGAEYEAYRARSKRLVPGIW